MDLERQCKTIKKHVDKVHYSPSTTFDAGSKGDVRPQKLKKSAVPPSATSSPLWTEEMALLPPSRPPSPPPPPPLPLLPRERQPQEPASAPPLPLRALASNGSLFFSARSELNDSEMPPPPLLPQPPGGVPLYRVASSGYTVSDAPMAQPPTPPSLRPHFSSGNVLCGVGLVERASARKST